MAAKKATTGGGDARGTTEKLVEADGPTVRTVAWVQFLGGLSERFGTAFMLLVVCLAAVRIFGDAKTQNDFIREMLFGEITGKPTTRVFFAALVLLSLLGSTGLFRRLVRDGAELKRVTAEKSRLQEKLIGSELSHTQGKDLA